MDRDVHIKADKLGIMRGERVLFRDVSLTVRTGGAVLLRGANGAGKTTLLRCLAGLTRAQTGVCTREVFHWIGHRSGVKPHETPFDHLYVWAATYGASRVNTGAVVQKMGLQRAKNVVSAQLSAGQKRRTALGRTQLARRPLWLLDEPFAALDADGKSLLSDLIDEHRRDGGSIIAAVHGEVPISDTEEVRL